MKRKLTILVMAVLFAFAVAIPAFVTNDLDSHFNITTVAHNDPDCPGADPDVC